MPDLEPIVGRYLRLTLGGRAHRVYFEEAGQGIPLVCLHTAGSDGRQFRHLMLDDAVTRHYRVIAFDMPWHGKSLPPAGWQDEEYRLTTERYVDLIMTFCRALELIPAATTGAAAQSAAGVAARATAGATAQATASAETPSAAGAMVPSGTGPDGRPVVMGCSIGGKIVLQLALEHPEAFRALIGLESAAYQPPWYDDTSWLHRPDIHGGEIAGAMMSGLIAPQSPAETRWETLWGYMQGGPGVFKGDLHFYRLDGDFRDRVGRIDTSRCPLYLLTGEYDFSCTPDDTRATAETIPGTELTIMQEIGHFPMSEYPEQFRKYLLPLLDEIRGASR